MKKSTTFRDDTYNLSVSHDKMINNTVVEQPFNSNDHATVRDKERHPTFMSSGDA